MIQEILLLKMIFLRFLILFLLINLCWSLGFGQLKEKKEKTDLFSKNRNFIILPEFGFSPETGSKFGVFAVSSFYTDSNKIKTRNSTVSFNTFYTTKNQFNFSTYSSLWTKNNKAHYTADLSYINFPLNFYGLGNNTADSSKQLLDSKRIRAIVEYEFLIRRNLYAGTYLSYQNDQYSTRENGIFESLKPNGNKGGNLGFIGTLLIFDNRDYQTFAKKGAFHKIQFRIAPNVLLNEYSVFRLNIQTRKYQQLHTNLFIAGQLQYQYTGGNNVPFYLLNELGNSNSMRGYYAGRFRDQSLLTGQAELRWWPLKRFIFAAFGGAGNVYGKYSSSENIKPNYGAGFRFVYDLIGKQSLRFDYGFGEKNTEEKRIQGFYISVNEAF